MVNANIRRRYDLIGEKNIFSEKFEFDKTVRNKNHITWMPDLLALFYLIFPIFQMLLFISFYSRIDVDMACSMNAIDIPLTVTLALSWIALWATLYGPCYYFQKAFRELRDKRQADEEQPTEDEDVPSCVWLFAKSIWKTICKHKGCVIITLVAVAAYLLHLS